MINRIAPRFARYEPLRHAAELMAGMVSGLDRKNCWTIAEHRGDATPDGLQHLLSRAKWDAEAVRDDLRDYVVDAFGDPGALLVLDETGDVKKGVHSVGVQRQYTGTAGRIENAQVAVYLTYAAPRGHALIDRALYLPKSWTEDQDRCDEAGIPTNRRCFATKPALAAALVARAVEAKVPAAWVAGDEVYGADPGLRAAIRGHRLGYVLAVAANRRVPTPAGPIRVDQLHRQLPKRAWQKHSAGAGSHGPRIYSWAWIALLRDYETRRRPPSFADPAQRCHRRAGLPALLRPPRSHGPPRHDHDHDQATRPNLTVFKHPLRHRGPPRRTRPVSAPVSAANKSNQRPIFAHHGAPRRRRRTADLQMWVGGRRREHPAP